jgi:hypothetical protein
MFSALKKWFAPKKKTPQRRHSVHPQLELLEDRLVPATTYNFSGANAGNYVADWEDRHNWTVNGQVATGYPGQIATDDIAVIDGGVWNAADVRWHRIIGVPDVGELHIKNGFTHGLLLVGSDLILHNGGELTSAANIVNSNWDSTIIDSNIDIAGGTFIWSAGDMNGPTVRRLRDSMLTVENNATLLYNNNGTTQSNLGFSLDVKAGGTFQFNGTASMAIYQLANHHISNEGAIDFMITGTSDTVGGIIRYSGLDAYTYIDNTGGVKQEGRSLSIKEPFWNDGGWVQITINSLRFYGQNDDFTAGNSFYQTGAAAHLELDGGVTLYGDRGIDLAAGVFHGYGTRQTDTLGAGPNSGVTFGSAGAPLTVTLDSTAGPYWNKLSIVAGTGWYWANGSIALTYDAGTGMGSQILASSGAAIDVVLGHAGLSMTMNVVDGFFGPNSWLVIDGGGGDISDFSDDPAPVGYSGGVVLSSYIIEKV